MRANYYPAWRALGMATAKSRSIRVPASWRSALPGTALTRFASSIRAIAACLMLALLALVGGAIALAKWPLSSRLAFASARLEGRSS